MSESLLAPTFLFRFSAPCPRVKATWSNQGVKLPDECELPFFGELEQRKKFADVRVGWSPQGLLLTAVVAGKKQPVWCRDSRIEDSDGVQIWIDTRDTHNIHRAGRFCHRFAFLPVGGGNTFDKPVSALCAINRARESPRPIAEGAIKLRSEKRRDGYALQAFIPADALTGFAPADHPRLGFFYLVMDRELGWQTWSVDTAFPFFEDPSVWGTLELQDI